MDFSLSNEQRHWQMTARKFTDEEIRPISLARDAIEEPRETFDWDIVKKGSKLGFRTMAVPKDYGGQDYSSARLITNGKVSWTYGFFEIRAKLPCGRGTWPAIWMLPTKMNKWPDDGEIDIMEQVGAERNLIYASLHTGLFNHVQKTQRSAQKLLPTSCSAFHIYQLDWRPNSIAASRRRPRISGGISGVDVVGARLPAAPWATPSVVAVAARPQPFSG